MLNIEYNFEEVRIMAKVIGYEHSISNCISFSESENVVYDLFSKNPIQLKSSTEDNEIIICKEWLKCNSLYILTNSSFQPHIRKESLYLVRDFMLKNDLLTSNELVSDDNDLYYLLLSKIN